MLHGHGDDGYRAAREVKANFSSNVWYEGPHSLLLEELAAAVNEVGNYPEPAAESLTRDLEEQCNVRENQILVCNGATEAFYLLAQVFAGADSTIVVPAFAEYEDSCRIFNHPLSFRTYPEFWEMDPSRSGLVWLCNPNNPDGNLIPAGKLTRFIEEHPALTFMVDESYVQFSAGPQSVLGQINRLSNLVVVRSMTKYYAIPGLRLGYVAASFQMIERLKAVKQPWSVNALALKAGQLILKHNLQAQRDLSKYLKITTGFMAQISEIEGFEPLPSATPYFLVKLSKGDSGRLKAFLLEEHGLLIRDASNFRSLDYQYIRVATQTPEKNQLLINALKEWNRYISY